MARRSTKKATRARSINTPKPHSIIYRAVHVVAFMAAFLLICAIELLNFYPMHIVDGFLAFISDPLVEEATESESAEQATEISSTEETPAPEVPQPEPAAVAPLAEELLEEIPLKPPPPIEAPSTSPPSMEIPLEEPVPLNVPFNEEQSADPPAMEEVTAELSSPEEDVVESELSSTDDPPSEPVVAEAAGHELEIELEEIIEQSEETPNNEAIDESEFTPRTESTTDVSVVVEVVESTSAPFPTSGAGDEVEDLIDDGFFSPLDDEILDEQLLEEVGSFKPLTVSSSETELEVPSLEKEEEQHPAFTFIDEHPCLESVESMSISRIPLRLSSPPPSIEPMDVIDDMPELQFLTDLLQSSDNILGNQMLFDLKRIKAASMIEVNRPFGDPPAPPAPPPPVEVPESPWLSSRPPAPEDSRLICPNCHLQLAYLPNNGCCAYCSFFIAGASMGPSDANAAAQPQPSDVYNPALALNSLMVPYSAFPSPFNYAAWSSWPPSNPPAPSQSPSGWTPNDPGRT